MLVETQTLKWVIGKESEECVGWINDERIARLLCGLMRNIGHMTFHETTLDKIPYPVYVIVMKNGEKNHFKHARTFLNGFCLGVLCERNYKASN